jgi:hypothetical protein
MNLRQQSIGQRLLLSGLSVQLGALAVISSVEHPSRTGFVAALVAIVATVTYIAGLGVYARAKGHHPAWCLLGLFSVIGLSVVMALPDLE